MDVTPKISDTGFMENVHSITKKASKKAIYYITIGDGANRTLECRLQVSFKCVKSTEQVAAMFPGCTLSITNDLVESTKAELDQDTVDLLTSLRMASVNAQDAGAGDQVATNKVSSLPDHPMITP